MVLAVAIGLLGVAPTAPHRPPPVVAQASAQARPRSLPLPLHGLTLERVTPLPATVRAVAAHRAHPTVRLVFQRGTGPAAYARAVRRLRPHASLMGEVVDSTAVRALSVSAYRKRTRAYVNRFGARIDLWEIGNELNGEWLGRPRRINAKVLAAYRVVEKEHTGLRSAITLNYWPSRDCYAKPWEATLRFARRMPGEVRHGVDYVFLSFYETACEPVARPSARKVGRTFAALKRIFPRARVGFGEIGAQRRSDGLPSNPTLAEKQRVAKRYYGMHQTLRHRLGRRYVGGYFWWYYADDAVPRHRPRSLWPTLDRLFRSY